MDRPQLKVFHQPLLLKTLQKAIFGDQKVTYDEILTEARKFGAGLLKSGLKKGDPVGLWAQNCREWYIVKWGCLLAGLPLVTLNPYYTASELEYAINKIGISAIEKSKNNSISQFVNNVFLVCSGIRKTSG